MRGQNTSRHNKAATLIQNIAPKKYSKKTVKYFAV